MSGFSKIFIDRPIFAGVISVVIVFIGAIAYTKLPIAQYPEITPPTVEVTCTYPGANARVVAETVASPIEQQVTGVERFLYMSSRSSNDGVYTLTVTFELGTNVDIAQVQVQNRVNLALPTLPPEVKQTGVSVKKKSPSILLVVNLTSPDGSRDQLYLSNYATISVKDRLAELDGVGDVTIMGQADYSMRIWLDPDKVSARNLTAGDIATALREQNVQVAAGSLGRAPVPSGQDFQYSLTALGRLTSTEQFSDIIVRTGADGEVTRLGDVTSKQREVTDADGNKRIFGGIELGSKLEDTTFALDGKPSAGLAVYQLPGSNAIKTAKQIKAKMAELKQKNFPPGVDYAIVYDTTPFIEESITAVKHTLFEAVILVAIVVLMFLQTWRATVIPLLAVPVAIVGTFSLMLLFGFSLNNLSLLGMVLAIGIVVDDAIVVVEAVEHHLEHGLSPREATRKAMDEVAGPIVAISLVLMVVFIPCAFITGVTGQFFRQFAVTVAVSTFFSCVNSLTLSPALCALLLKSKAEQRDPFTRVMNLTMGWFFKMFNWVFDRTTTGYTWVVGTFLRLSLIALAVYGGLLFLTYYGFTSVPVGFVPLQDKGYLIVDVQLPDASSLERSKQVMAELERIARGDPADQSKYPGIPGIAHTISIPGQSVLQGANGSNFGAMYVVLEPFEHRHGKDLSGPAVAAKLRAEVFRHIQGASVAVFGAPAIDGLGNAGGFKLMIQDQKDLGLDALQEAADGVAEDGNKRPGLVGMFNTLRARTPQMFVDINRTKCKQMGVPLSDVFLALQVYLGGYYVNDINRFGRTWQVNIQADPGRRIVPDDVKQLKIRNADGDMVPMSSLVDIQPYGGPLLITRYNSITAATVNGASAPTMSSGDMIKSVEASTANLPEGMSYEWTELTFLQIEAGNTALIVFAVAVILVYLLLAAQYESLRLPLAVILVVPMCLLCSVIGVALAKLDINIFVQIGFVVLVGLASKNAILIVEFAKEERAKGMPAFDAAVKACKLRLRPILMTSFAFILGVVPLALSTGAGAEMRRPLGIAVFTGMLGVTVFGIFLTPVFYYVLESLGGKKEVGKRPELEVSVPESKKEPPPDGIVTHIAQHKV